MLFRNAAKAAVLLAALGGAMVVSGSLLHRGGAVLALAATLVIVGVRDGYGKRVPIDIPRSRASHRTVDPLSGRPADLQPLFRTHPTTEQRVARLRGLHV